MTFEGYIIADTVRAVLFQSHYWHAAEWMPKSQIAIRREDDTPEVVIVATPWIAGQKGLEEFTERVAPDADADAI